MLTIRPIAAGELSAFLALQPDPGRAADQAAYLDRMFSAGAMRPEWCYVAADGDGVVGRFAFWSLPTLNVPISIVLLDVAGSLEGPPARASIADALLQRAVEDALAGSPEEFGYVLDEPAQSPQWQLDPDERAGWLERAGFEVVRSTSRWSYEGPPPEMRSRLTFRTYEEVGEAAFLNALEEVNSSTLDARVEADRGRLGAAAEARSTLEDVRALGVEPGWWQLAYDASGTLVGLVMPARAPAMTTIGYIGVVPSQRGRRYVDDLLAQGTALLRHDVSDMVIRADTDLANAPMAAAFERAGYARFATRREYELSTLSR
jgi:RimJ/RimL family protein N-acetyltransferase